MTTAAPARMLTPPEAAHRLRVDPSRVITWIRDGSLRAIDVSAKGTIRPRFRIDWADLAIFENSLAVSTTPKRRRRRKRDDTVTEYF